MQQSTCGGCEEAQQDLQITPMQQIEDFLVQAKITTSSWQINFEGLFQLKAFPKCKRKLIILKRMCQYQCFCTMSLLRRKPLQLLPCLITLTHLNTFCSFEIMSTSRITTFERGREKQAEDQSKKILNLELQV